MHIHKMTARDTACSNLFVFVCVCVCVCVCVFVVCVVLGFRAVQTYESKLRQPVCGIGDWTRLQQPPNTRTRCALWGVAWAPPPNTRGMRTTLWRLCNKKCQSVRIASAPLVSQLRICHEPMVAHAMRMLDLHLCPCHSQPGYWGPEVDSFCYGCEFLTCRGIGTLQAGEDAWEADATRAQDDQRRGQTIISGRSTRFVMARQSSNNQPFTSKCEIANRNMSS